MQLASTFLATWTGRAIAGAAIVAIVGGVVIAPRLGGASPAAEIRTAPVARASVTQTVAISGAVDAAAEIRLSFGTAGRLAEVLVGIGEKVVAGQPLARLVTDDLARAVTQAEASLASAQARYDSTVAGISVQDLALAKVSLDDARRRYAETQTTVAADLAAAELALSKAQTNYTSARTDFTALTAQASLDAQSYQAAIGRIRSDVLALRDDLDAMDRAVLNGAVDALETAAQDLATAETHAASTLQTAAAEFAATATAVRMAVDAFDRAVAESRDTSSAYAQLRSAETAFDAASSRFTNALDGPGAEVAQAEGSAASAHAVLTSKDSDLDSDTTLNDARGDIVRIQIAVESEQQLASAIRSTVARAEGALTTLADNVAGGYLNALQAHATAKARAASSLADQASALRTAELSYQKTTAAPKDSDVSSAYASLLQAQAAVESARADLDSATLTAPSSGVVAVISGQVGETVSSGGTSGFMVLADTAGLVLHGTVGESEVAGLELDQVATVVVDAVGGETSMTGKVTAIDPVATIQQGVPVYGVDVRIDIPAEAVRAGMTGTATVIVANKPDVLTVPNLAIRSQSGRRFVQILREGKIVDATVAFGISNETVTEVTQGLAEGDEVVLPQPRTSTPAANRLGGPVQGGGGAVRR